jgi:predicted ATPase/DNA-binding SARP family transcriptional activator
MAGLSLTFFGPPRLELDGVELHLDTRKAIALLAYLAQTERAQSREALAALLFPEYDDDRAFANLRRTLWTLNKAGLGPYLDLSGATIALRPFSPAAGLACDVDGFHRALAGCAGHGHDADEVCPECVSLLSQAAELYRGDFLAGFTLKDSAEFDEWQFFQAETLRREAAGMLDRLSQGLAAAGDYPAAIASARRWLALDPLHEPAQRQLMRLYAASGQRTAALRQYQECVRVLADELGAEPEAETAALYEEIRRAPTISRMQTANSALKAMRSHARPPRLTPEVTPTPPPLPQPPAPFVGRRAELARIRDLLADPKCRLLTVTGPGGIGKTRLALQAAASAAASTAPDSFAGNVYFVALAALASPELLPSAVAVALGLRPGEGARSADDHALVFDFLRARRALLVMDNFEHLLAGVDFLAGILAAAPGVKLLVTSRERLNAPGEWVFEATGMPYPTDGESASGAGGAADLFLQYATQARADFVPGSADWPEIARICRLVEGSPLGIELAAAWVRLLTPAEIAGEIAADLDFLKSTQRGLPERQRSLRAAFEYSWRLLSDDERDALCRLAVFRGGFTRPAAAAVAGASLPILAMLESRSLVHVVTSGRYDMHEVLKQYAAEKLEVDPALQAETLVRHAGYFLGLLAEAEKGLQCSRQKDVLAELAAEIGNLRRAFDTTTDVTRLRAAPTTGSIYDAISLPALVRAMSALILFYLMRGRHSEGDELFGLAVTRLLEVEQACPALPGLTEALALLMAAAAFTGIGLHAQEHVAFLFGGAIDRARRLPACRTRAHALSLVGFGTNCVSYTQAEALYQETMAFFGSTGDRWGLALARLRWADNPHPVTNGLTRAAAYQASLQDYTALGDRWCMALCYNGLAAIAYWGGDYSAAQGYARQSLDIYQALDEPWRAADIRFYLAATAMDLGAYEEARAYWEENLAFVRDMGRLTSVATCYDCLAAVDYQLGRYAAARQNYLAALDIHRRLDLHHNVAVSLGGLGLTALALGHGTEARSCYQEAAALAATLSGQRMEDWQQAICFKNLGRLSLGLGERAAAADHLRRALAAALQSKRIPEVLEVLGRLAQLLAEGGELARAVEALAQPVVDPATPHSARTDAEALLSRLAVQLAPDDYEAALARGRSRQFSTWLEEFTPAPVA